MLRRVALEAVDGQGRGGHQSQDQQMHQRYHDVRLRCLKKVKEDGRSLKKCRNVLMGEKLCYIKLMKLMLRVFN